MTDQSLFQRALIGIDEVVAQPVEPDRHGGGHFADVEEVVRVPVGKRRDGEQFLARAAKVASVAIDSVRERQR